MALQRLPVAADPFLVLMHVLLQPLGYRQLAAAVVNAIPDAFAPPAAVLGALLLTLNAETHQVEAFAYTHGAHHADIARELAEYPLQRVGGDYRRQSNLVERVAAQQTAVEAPHLRAFLSGYLDVAVLDRLEHTIGWLGGMAMPIRAQQRSAGVLLYALGKDITTLTEAERLRMTNVAHLIGLALEQVRLYEAERRRAHEAAALQAVRLRIATADDAGAMLEEILSAALDLLGADYAAVNTIPTRPGEQAWHVRRGYRSDASIQSTIHPPGTGLAGRSMQARAAVVVREFGTDPSFPVEEFPVHIAEGMQSGMGVPLLRPTAEAGGTGEAFGALVVGYRSRERINRDQVDLATILAQHAAVALERARLFAVERTRAAELEALVASGHQLSAEIDPGAVLRAIASVATDMLGATGATVAVVEWPSTSERDPATARLIFREWYQEQRWHSPDHVVQAWEPTARQALVAGEIRLITERLRRGEDSTQTEPQLPSGGVIALPIQSHSRALAVVVLLGKRDGRSFDEADTRVLRAFAEQAATALENARLYEQERRARRDVEQAQEQGQAFLRIVAHDLKTPLTNILGYAQLAQRLLGRLMTHVIGAPNDVDNRLRLAFEKIVDNSRRLQRLVDDLQEAFRLGSGRFELQRERVDLAALTRQTVEEQRAVAPDHQFTVSVPTQPLFGEWDAERLHQVVANLVSNAIKYSPEGGAITVTLQRRGALVVLTVADCGLGIPREHLPALFQPYSRLHQSRAIKGTGLGLYIVKGIVEAHGGSVSADSAGEGAGALFRVTLPLQSGSPARHTAAKHDTVSNASRLDTPPANGPASPAASS